MRYFCIVCIFMLSGCINMPLTSSLDGYDENKIKEIIQIGETTNTDILKIFKRPSHKIEFLEGGYSYIYQQYSDQNGNFITSQLTLVSLISENKNVNLHLASFEFTPDNKLADFFWDERDNRIFYGPKRSKYDTFVKQNELAGNIEKVMGEITKGQYDEVYKGQLKGPIYMEFGEPMHIDEDEEKDEERWSYRDIDEPMILYMIIIKDDKVTSKRSMKYFADFSPEEQAYF